MSRTPYRSAGRPGKKRLRIGFFHARFSIAVVVASVFLAIAFGFLTLPRMVTVECEPVPGVELRCRSSARSIWGTSRWLTATVNAGGHPIESLDLNLEYSQPTRGDSYTTLVARYAWQPTSPITRRYPSDLGGRMLTDVFAFEEKLRAGNRATFVYASGWGGLIVFVPCTFIALLALWLNSGRTVVVYEPADGRVEASTRSLWPFRARRRDLAYADITEVVVEASPGDKGSTVYRPGFALRSKEVVTLGDVGLTTPDRARHFAVLLGKLLELPVRESESA